MRRSRSLLALLLFGVLIACLPRFGSADDIPYWPNNQKERLKEVDKEYLAVQRERFNVIFFSKDPAEKERIDKRFKEIQTERRRLIEAVGN